MVFGLVIDYGLKASIFLSQKVYDGAVYLWYGKQETNEEKILRELKEENQELKNQIQILVTESNISVYSK